MPALQPLISVIVPVYNVQGYVGPCLASLAAQDDSTFEVIVVIDGATDGSLAEARATVGADPRFRIIEQANRGLSGARNAGLDLARGELIAFVDGDDRVAPTYLSAMREALEELGSDWVACGILYVDADGTEHPHSGIHDAPALMGEARRLPLSDWGDVIRLFPSAWNKLYRRSLIEGLRYDEGTYFEDHAFFYRASLRTDHILHLPQPLYIQTQGREGQITREDSDRVFEQLAVIETLYGIMHEGLESHQKSGAEAAFAKVATRLMIERTPALYDEARRTAFASAAGALLERFGVDYERDRDPALPLIWGERMAGRPALSVVIPTDGQAEPLLQTIQSLTHQDMRDFEVILVAGTESSHLPELPDIPYLRHLTASTPGACGARNTGLAAARGTYVQFLDAGDTLIAHRLRPYVECALRARAQIAVAPFWMGESTEHFNTGFHVERAPDAGPLPLDARVALDLNAHPSAKLFDREMLLTGDVRFDADPLGTWGMLLRSVGEAADGFYWDQPLLHLNEAPACRQTWRARVPAAAIAAALTRIAPEGLEPDAFRRLLARAFWEKAHFAEYPDEPARARFKAEAAAWVRRHKIAAEGPLDYYLGPEIEAIMRERD